LLKNYLWVGSTHNCCCRVVWDQCYAKEKERCLKLVDLVEAMDALQSKWVLHALEHGDSNLQEFQKVSLEKLSASQKQQMAT
jgi:hypothetical protein